MFPQYTSSSTVINLGRLGNSKVTHYWLVLAILGHFVPSLTLTANQAFMQFALSSHT